VSRQSDARVQSSSKLTQRSPRYKLLLQEVVHNTEETHPDFPNLKKALELVSDVAMHVNEAVKQAQARTKILEIRWDAHAASHPPAAHVRCPQ
jgi:hypothetical protein